MDKCYHDGCKCEESAVERAGRMFCSEDCAESVTQGSLAEAICRCGHPGCGQIRELAGVN